MATSTKIQLVIALHRSLDIPPVTKAAPVSAQPEVKEQRGRPTESTFGTRRYRPAPVTAEARQAVDAIIRRHRGMTKQLL